MMAAANESLASSPRKLAQLKDEDLDRFMEVLRKASMKAVKELSDLYTRLLSKLGTERIVELLKELEGIDQLFKWGRIEKSVEAVNEILSEKGFKPIEIAGPEDLSDAFKMELEEKWNSAFARFKLLAEQAAEEIGRQDAEGRTTPASAKPKKRSGKR
jgi:hypothetical protein